MGVRVGLKNISENGFLLSWNLSLLFFLSMFICYRPFVFGFLAKRKSIVREKSRLFSPDFPVISLSCALTIRWGTSERLVTGPEIVGEEVWGGRKHVGLGHCGMQVTPMARMQARGCCRGGGNWPRCLPVFTYTWAWVPRWQKSFSTLRIMDDKASLRHPIF